MHTIEYGFNALVTMLQPLMVQFTVANGLAQDSIARIQEDSTARIQEDTTARMTEGT